MYDTTIGPISSSWFWVSLYEPNWTTFISCTHHHYFRSSSSSPLPTRAERFGTPSQVYPMSSTSDSNSGSGFHMKGGFWTSHGESGLGRDDELNLGNLSKLIIPPLGMSSYNQTQINATGKIILPMDSRYRF